LYHLRRALLLLTLLSYLFATLTLTTPTPYSYYPDRTPYIWQLLLATLSALLSIYDLCLWAFHDPNIQPVWPLRRVIVGDIFLAVGFTLVWFGEGEGVGSLGASALLGAYASVVAAIMAVIHGVCSWRGIMAGKKREWEAEHGLAGGLEAGFRGVVCSVCRACLMTRCSKCGGSVVGRGDAERGCAREIQTPMSTGEGGLAMGYEVIPDRTPDREPLTAGGKGKGAARANSQTSLVEV
jgi:hypothetical protein